MLHCSTTAELGASVNTGAPELADDGWATATSETVISTATEAMLRRIDVTFMDVSPSECERIPTPTLTAGPTRTIVEGRFGTNVCINHQ